MMQRIFHPIGQGAFYSERHDGFNIVYDCGTEYKNRSNPYYNKVVTQSFRKDEEIDILFISHFDFDHISKIEILLNHVSKIKKVVMPLMHNKYLLAKMYKALGYIESYNLLINPISFFEINQIIYVLPGENGDEVNINQEPIDIENIKGDIKSGTVLKCKKGFVDWVFIPYNFKYDERSNDLKIAIGATKTLDYDKLCNDPNYALNEIVQPKNRAIIKKLYDNLDGDINENSMLLYSGPLNNNNYKRFISSFCDYHLRYYGDAKPACLYTGDANLNKIQIKKVFTLFWSFIGTIQIPHHGDIKAFDTSILADKNYVCPISYGTTNSYGHPSSKVIADVISYESIPFLVNEDIKSTLVETINII